MFPASLSHGDELSLPIAKYFFTRCRSGYRMQIFAIYPSIITQKAIISNIDHSKSCIVPGQHVPWSSLSRYRS
jgi:hypothetical protein